MSEAIRDMGLPAYRMLAADIAHPESFDESTVAAAQPETVRGANFTLVFVAVVPPLRRRLIGDVHIVVFIHQDLGRRWLSGLIDDQTLRSIDNIEYYDNNDLLD